MTTQIAVRLADDLVEFLDAAVASGYASSRASIVADALESERRKLAALSDVDILKNQGTEDDLDELVTWTARNTALDN